MPKKLTPEEIELRRKEAAQARELLMLERWENKRQEAEALIPGTSA
ncbi:hypothetical protein H6P1_00584 (plasmid) [Variovorax sp. PBL-H6]|nr:hypothetical protein SRS16P1_00346 [Variovorax sp. SRS16]VTU42768.1 hypothetical protein E5P1_00344 [Variovorax sp. PBL-E5]VTU43795.1 hypothetical protein H6P1_00584 [Variovorax sp. PBL-H6]